MMNNTTTIEGAVVYLTECTLATVEDLAGKKSAPKCERRRQIAIAQSGIDTIRFNQLPYRRTRVEAVIDQFDASVQRWADHEAAT